MPLQKDTIRMTSFSELPLSARMQQRLVASKFHIPTPIQAAAIPSALAGKDLVAFKAERAHILTEMAAMPLESKVADTGGDLRAAKD